MEITGTVQGIQIVLDGPIALPEGTRVHLDVSPLGEPQKGSPASLLRLSGTLSEQEADSILAAAQECRRIDPKLWNGGR